MQDLPRLGYLHVLRPAGNLLFRFSLFSPVQTDVLDSVMDAAADEFKVAGLLDEVSLELCCCTWQTALVKTCSRQGATPCHKCHAICWASPGQSSTTLTALAR